MTTAAVLVLDINQVVQIILGIGPQVQHKKETTIAVLKFGDWCPSVPARSQTKYGKDNKTALLQNV